MKRENRWRHPIRRALGDDIIVTVDQRPRWQRALRRLVRRGEWRDMGYMTEDPTTALRNPYQEGSR